MSKIQLGLAPTSVKLRVKLMDSSLTTGAGLTGLSSASSGLLISTLQLIEGANGEASATVYTVAGSTIETISTLGTYAAPTATKCRFKEVDSTNHPGIYEIQLADARLSASGDATKAMTLLVSISGATNLAQADIEIECRNQAVNMVAIDGQLTNGNNATLKLKKLDIQNSADVSVLIASTGTGNDGLKITSADGNGIQIIGYDNGVRITGTESVSSGILVNGSFAGINSYGENGIIVQGVGASGIGLAVSGGLIGANIVGPSGMNIYASPASGGDGLWIGGDGNGAGVKIIGAGTGAGVDITGGPTSGDGILSEGGGSGAGIRTNGGVDGHGIDAKGGAGSSTAGRSGIYSYGQGVGHGFNPVGSGTGAGIRATGGATGPGIYGEGGPASGSGIVGISQLLGNGIRAQAAGAGKAGIDATGGTDADGIHATGIGTGHGIRATGEIGGHGIYAKGGSFTGNGIYAEAPADGAGIVAAGGLTNAGIQGRGGPDGPGIEAVGGVTSGNGITARATTSGNGLQLTRAGTGKDLIGTTGTAEVNTVSIDGSTGAASNLKTAVNTEITGAVDNTAFAPTTTQFESSVILTESDVAKYRTVIFTGGALAKEARLITGYTLSGGRGKFTVDVLSNAPANADTFIVV